MEKNRYNNTKIYKLYDTVYGFFYIGSTCGTLAKRLYDHKAMAKRQPERKVYQCLNKIGWDNVKIVLIEEHFLDNKDQQFREETRVMEIYIHDDKCLNTKKPLVSLEEMKERKRNYEKEVRSKTEKRIQYKESYRKQYWELNKERINKERSLKLQCACGAEITVNHKKSHERTKKHQAWLHDQQQEAETI